MNFSKSFFCAAACGVAMLALSSSARADQGYAFIVTNTQAQSPSLATLAGAGDSTANPDVTFNVTGGLGSVNLNSSRGYTFGGFLGAGSGASSVSYPNRGNNNVPVVPSTPLYGDSNPINGPGYNPYGSIFEITGSVSAGETINITHDDGISLYINGTNIFGGSALGVGSNSTTVSTGGSYELVYGECCGAPAYLTVTTTTTTPEPTSIVLLATSLVGAGIAFRKRRKAA